MKPFFNGSFRESAHETSKPSIVELEAKPSPAKNNADFLCNSSDDFQGNFGT